ncbi:DUF927 domain-containing protein [Paraburkholderia sp. MM6662-R1]|uniref:DUF927 domain-containing protein n=1 Tax=Paraburkholderia sp. MM6662-R1 TaxID=2991066 RepID=UPI003D22EB72
MSELIMDEQQRIEAALAAIPPDIEREQWWRIGAALKHELGDGGFDAFDLWSRGGASYSVADVRDTWRSLSTDGRITIGTLYGIAKHYGFQLSNHAAPAVDVAVIERRRADRAARAEKAEAERLTRARAAATLAFAVLAKSSPARDDHPYLIRKGLTAPATLRELDIKHLTALLNYPPKQGDVPLTARVLLVRIETADGVTSLEMIDGDGRKTALSGGTKAGAYWLASQPGDAVHRIAIAEGVASALTHQQLYGTDLAVAALSAGNLPKVAEAMRAAYPQAVILIHGEIGNGAGKALEAAQSVGGALVIPDFGDDRPDDATDINDLFVLRGAEVARACVDSAQAVELAGEMDRGSASFPRIEERPCWRVYDAWEEIDGRRMKPGVYWHGVKLGKGDAPPEMVDKWISSPLWVAAITRNQEDAEYGRLLELLSPAGRRKKWAMPMSMLAGDGNEVRAVLLSEGLVFDLNDRQAVPRYIAGQHPKLTMRAASVTGWHAGAFVLPEVVIGADDIWFQSTGRTAPYSSAGTFEQWRELAALAVDNRLLVFAMCAGFAGPLLGPLNIDGGGAHLYGDSSHGKTTAARAAISIWGSPRFERKWRATSNGLEGTAALHSDTLLMLDEIGEIKPHDLYETAYALANGMGKTRANRHGEARQATRWRVFVLSTGEPTVAARMAAGGIEAKAGQAVRLLDVPVTGTYGVFETLHGRASGSALSDEMRAMAATHYGHAGPRFIEALVRELRADFRLADALHGLLERFDAAEGQERRAARLFAVCALAGEMAIAWGIVPWQSDEPTRAALHAFNLWRRERPPGGQSAEHAAILRAVADFIDRYGDSRFSNIEGSADLIRDRAGYWKQDGERRLYLFTSGGLREATKGNDFNRALRALDEAGAIADRGKVEIAKVTHTPERKKRLYHIDPSAIEGGGE